MSRQDANRLALEAAADILDAAGPLEVRIGSCTITVEPERQPPVPWPEQKLDGISDKENGPWPAPVKLECTWEGGSCTMMMMATSLRPRTRESRQVSIMISAAGQWLVWLSTAMQIRNARDGDEAQVYALPSTTMHRGEYAHIREHLNQRIRELVHASGLPLLSPGRIDAFRVHITGKGARAAVLPSPAQAYRHLVHLALIKLPFLVRGEQRAVIRGRSYIDIDAIVRQARDMLASGGGETASGKYISIGRMPGGHRGYKATLDRMLQFVRETSPTPERFDRFLEDEIDITSPRARDTRLLRRLQLILEEDGAIKLSDRAYAYLADPSASRLFRMLHETFEGMLETLVIAAQPGGADPRTVPQLLAALCDLSDTGQSQITRRLNWLTSLGLTERIGGMDRITPAGRKVLEEYADEVDELDALLDSVLMAPDAGSAPPRRSDDDDTSGDDVDDEDSQAAVPEVEERREPPANWAEDQLDLLPGSVAPYAEHLSLPDGLIEQICAALSAGKHLLLVGPPGTGKTEIAHALARAAQVEMYCAGLFTATASADWTTYETIGGYSIQRDGNLRFRPGAFLRAVEMYQWLLIDELNRADVDKAFGELMTVLAGRDSDTPYELDNGRHISIGTDRQRCTHWVPRTFRVLATMNTWDKTSLFRLSYALQRRFAIVHVGVPAPERYAAIIARDATVEDADEALDTGIIDKLQRLFSPDGLLQHRAIGPAMARDMVRYMRRRKAGGNGMAEAMAMFLLPQLEGMDSVPAKGAWGIIRDLLRGWASDAAIRELGERYRELFPLMDELQG